VVTESILVVSAAGILGFQLATAALHVVRAGAVLDIPRLEEVSVDGRVALLAALLSALTMLLASGLPVSIALRQGIADSLRSTRVAAPGMAARSLRSVLVVSEIALTLVLLLGSGLLIRSLWEVRGIDLGFDEERLVAVRVFPPLPRYSDPESALALYRRLEEAAAAIPGVTSAGLINHMPAIGGGVGTVVEVPGRITEPNEELVAGYRVVSTSYLETAGVQILDGRPPAPAAPALQAVPLMINARLASTLWPADRAVGRTLTVYRQSPDRTDRGAPIDGQIVAVLGDVRADGPENDPVPEVYVPIDVEVWGNVTLVVRTEGDPRDLTGALRSAILEVEPDIPVASVQTVSQALGGPLVGRRQMVTLLGAFAAFAALLAGGGLYALLALMVRERVREFAIRAALGATSRSLTILMFKVAASLGAVGVGMGFVLASLALGAIRADLFDVSPADPAVLLTALATTMFTVIAATWLPARRASSGDVGELIREG
jgi:predicted permease